MLCTSQANLCIDHLYSLEMRLPGAQSNTMPPCSSEWNALSTPLPNGSYALVFTGRVSERDAVLTLLSSDGKLFASLRYPEERSWECKNPAKTDFHALWFPTDPDGTVHIHESPVNRSADDSGE